MTIENEPSSGDLRDKYCFAKPTEFTVCVWRAGHARGVADERARSAIELAELKEQADYITETLAEQVAELKAEREAWRVSGKSAELSILRAEKARREGERGPRPKNPYPNHQAIWNNCADAIEAWCDSRCDSTRAAREEPIDHVHWRIGRTVGCTLYRGDLFVGSCVSPYVARQLVTAANGAREEPSEADVERLALVAKEADPGGPRYDRPDLEHRRWLRVVRAVLAELAKPPNKST